MAFARADEPGADGEAAFSVTDYRLAFVNLNKQGDVVNEYVLREETLENWTSMIAVRQWPQANELKEIIGPYVRKLQPLYARDAQVFQREGKTENDDVIFEFYLAPQDRSYLEYNLIRFVREKGSSGVKSYQFAVRGDYNLEAAVKFNAPRLKSRLDTIARLTLEASTEPLKENKGADSEKSEGVTNDAARNEAPTIAK